MVVMQKKNPKIAILHDYLVDRGGAERVVISLAKAFPEAPIYTSVFIPGKTFDFFTDKKVIYSKTLNALMGTLGKRELLAPLLPLYFRFLNLKKYDLVISSSSAFAIHARHKKHICYCHTPARFIWRTTDYNRNNNFLKKIVLQAISAFFKPGDYWASQHIHTFITNAKNIKKRIQACYKKAALVLPPAIDTHCFTLNKKSNYFFVLSRLKPYKQVDQAIEAFNALGLPLLIAGSGSEEKNLKALAKANIKFLGRVSDKDLFNHYSAARAFIFPGEEDFGITPLEAMASGCPVIGFGRGGLTETVINGTTGLLYKKQTAKELQKTVLTFIKKEKSFDPKKIQKHASQFDEKVFIKKIQEIVYKNPE